MSHVPSEPFSVTPVPEMDHGLTRRTWKIKLAALLVVAALCIAFAGLVWALLL